uniref:NADH-ubiquinone oxidoreductase chain 3 n=1 Tax=Macracanthorhynchus hirudinaceus TaxID=1032456 RepID=K0JAJ3_MACHR|nr:NADH dehydrogenase subunit 3 [Macracanthorhynchus hirudinaceus]CCA94501.2 NADH Dehydrogenase subunit 3 [Macracanthorhynchus hirudinaceus]
MAMIIGFISIGMWLISLIIMSRSLMVDNFTSAFECGFTSMFQEGVKMSVRFYHMLVVFLLMDVEVVMLFFMPYVKFMSLGMVYGMAVVVVVIYFIGLLYELFIGGLSWSE